MLHIYDLLPQSSAQQQQAQSSSSTSQQPPQQSRMPGFLSGLLSPLGFGAYHTSIDVRGFRYQFGAGFGISRSTVPQNGWGETADSRRYVPPNGAYKESVIVGQTWCEQGDINAIIQRMREDKFEGENYHLANRNCNHFTETFAMALIFGNELLESNNANIKLETFPAWVNRLARTGTSWGLDDGNACDVLAEAKTAAGLKGKVGWGLNSPTESKKSSTSSTTAANRSQKKQLTEKQKAALAKLKKGSK